MNFEDLLKQVTPRLKAITRRLDGRYTAFDDDDLYQEAILHLWKKFNKNELFDKTESYILQGCLFFLQNYIRKIHKAVDRNSIRLDAHLAGSDCSLEDIFLPASKEERSVDLLVQDVENVLNKREKKVLFLSLEGLTKREIGKRLGVSHVMVMKIEKGLRTKCERLKKGFVLN